MSAVERNLANYVTQFDRAGWSGIQGVPTVNISATPKTLKEAKKYLDMRNALFERCCDQVHAAGVLQGSSFGRAKGMGRRLRIAASEIGELKQHLEEAKRQLASAARSNKQFLDRLRGRGASIPEALRESSEKVVAFFRPREGLVSGAHLALSPESRSLATVERLKIAEIYFDPKVRRLFGLNPVTTIALVLLAGGLALYGLKSDQVA